MAIIIVLVLLWRTGPGDGTAVFVVVVAAPPLREAVVEYSIAPPVVAVAATEVVVAATEVSDTRGDMVGVEARLDMDW